MAFNYIAAIEELKKITPANAEHAGMIAATIKRFEDEAAKQSADKTDRSLLIAAGRVARASGFAVKSSKSRDGKISSFYATKGTMKIRISDHALPDTGRRSMMGLLPEIIVSAETDVEVALAEICAA